MPNRRPILDLASSPALYPFSFDPASGRTQLVALDEAGYRAASFLDERLQDAVGPGEWVSWLDLQAASAELRGDCDFIFHIGHVGSTLLSRLLDQDERIFSLREPAVLRTLAQAELDPVQAPRLDDWTPVFLRLWARAWRRGQRTLLKATSFTAELAPRLMGLDPSARAILMFVTPSVYLAGVLASEGARRELDIAGALRLKRLHRRLGRPVWSLEALSGGELAAMSWLSEITALAEAARAAPGRILWLDFEAFLTRPGVKLAACLARLQGEARPGVVEAMLASADMTRYSKAPEFAYDAALRRRVLAQSTQEHGEQIGRGIAWLNAAGNAHPVLADAMRQVGAASRAG